MKDGTVGIIYTLSLVAFLMRLLFPAVLLLFPAPVRFYGRSDRGSAASLIRVYPL